MLLAPSFRLFAPCSRHPVRLHPNWKSELAIENLLCPAVSSVVKPFSSAAYKTASAPPSPPRPAHESLLSKPSPPPQTPAARKPVQYFSSRMAPEPAGDISNLATVRILHLISIPCDSTLGHLEAHQSPFRARSFRFLQRSTADEFRLLHLAEAVQSRFPHIDRIRNLVPVEW